MAVVSRTLVLAAAGLVSAGCSPRTRVVEYKPGPPLPRHAVAIPAEWHIYRSDTGPHDHTRLVVRDSAAWRLAWSTIHANHMPRTPNPADPPPVDFGESVVLVAGLGYRGCLGHAIRMDSLALTLGEPVTVFVASVSPDDSPGVGCLTDIVRPVDVVKVPLRTFSHLPVMWRELPFVFDEEEHKGQPRP